MGYNDLQVQAPENLRFRTRRLGVRNRLKIPDSYSRAIGWIFDFQVGAEFDDLLHGFSNFNSLITNDGG